ncbi:hypothetical protein [Chryseobacterium sp. Leaf394]|uniref:hypothetical protein n=1 Tax=Chryseobacterium sp. Leaf394 TaxID=1736361 RepID=UPI0006FC8A63|nr:hypothetical protein [Chryseobacterium sp. Leaf394]KQS94187.1 hypothetical protein ASG21_18230 [Chryseobacterium sp. Leaf394]
MKNIFNITFLCIVFSVNAQVVIGKSNLTTLPLPAAPNTVNPSISLEFGDYVTGQGKGLVLPWTTSAMDKASAVEGTIIYDTTDHTVKYKNGASAWEPLSKNETAPSPINNTQGVANTALQDPFDDAPAARTSIGTLSTVPGILVLEDNDKAMILPKVESPHLNIINPEPGTMVYDTLNHHLAIYNGKVWSFWKP